MSTLWIPSREELPTRSNYFLVTKAPANHTGIDLDGSQNYGRKVVSSAWFNEFTKRWFTHRPGSGKSFESNWCITHWAEMPEGQTLSQEDLDALPSPRYRPVHFNLLDEVGHLLILGENLKASQLLREKLLPLLEEK